MATATHIPTQLALDIHRALEALRTWRRLGDTVGEGKANERLNELLDQVKR